MPQLFIVTIGNSANFRHEHLFVKLGQIGQFSLCFRSNHIFDFCFDSKRDNSNCKMKRNEMNEINKLKLFGFDLKIKIKMKTIQIFLFVNVKRKK